MNQRQLKRRTVRKQAYGTHRAPVIRCGRCGTPGAHYVLLHPLNEGDRSEGFWTCPDLYDEHGIRKELASPLSVFAALTGVYAQQSNL